MVGLITESTASQPASHFLALIGHLVRTFILYLNGLLHTSVSGKTDFTSTSHSRLLGLSWPKPSLHCFSLQYGITFQVVIMADLLSSLVLPNSSQESFHSTYSSHSPIQSSPRLSQATATQQTDLTNTCDSSGSGKSSKSEIPTAASSSQAQSHHSLHDIDAYLNDHANKTSPENGSEKNFAPGPSTSTAKSSKASSNGSTLKNSESIQVGGPKSSHHVTLLFQMCQERGLVPEFDIKEDPPMSQQFRGTLTVGGATITLETSEASKKDARQSLAARGCELVRDMSSPKSSGNSTTGTENWVGKLLGK